MSKYEMIVVVSAKLEDEERTAALEKVQKYITRFGGTVESVDDWGKIHTVQVPSRRYPRSEFTASRSK